MAFGINGFSYQAVLSSYLKKVFTYKRLLWLTGGINAVAFLECLLLNFNFFFSVVYHLLCFHLFLN